MEAEPFSKDDSLERSIEDIRCKMREKRRKKDQADRSLSKSHRSKANLVLKATLRQNNRSLAKSLECSRNEFRQTQQELLAMQRERHLLQSIVNRFQDQHSKQRDQIRGVREVLNRVTASLLNTVTLIGEALDMCTIPRQTKDSSLGLVFRPSSITSDDISFSDPGDLPAVTEETSGENLSNHPRRLPARTTTSKKQPDDPSQTVDDIQDPLPAPQTESKIHPDDVSEDLAPVCRTKSGDSTPATRSDTHPEDVSGDPGPAYGSKSGDSPPSESQARLSSPSARSDSHPENISVNHGPVSQTQTRSEIHDLPDMDVVDMDFTLLSDTGECKERGSRKEDDKDLQLSQRPAVNVPSKDVPSEDLPSVSAPSASGNAFQKTESVANPKKKPTSKLPVMKKTKTKKIPSKKSQSKSSTSKKDMRGKTDDKDVHPASVFDLSLGESFSHPTPPHAIKSHPKYVTVPDIKGQTTLKADGPDEDQPKGSAEDVEHETQQSGEIQLQKDTGKPNNTDAEDVVTGREHQKIRRKSRKSKTIVTPGATEAKVRLSERALLEELDSLDSSYLSDVTNQDRRSRCRSVIPSRRSSNKDAGETLNDLMAKPLSHRPSKRKLSKKHFYFGAEEPEDSQNLSESVRHSQGKSASKRTTGSGVPTSTIEHGEEYEVLQATSTALNSTMELLEGLETILSEENPVADKKMIKRRTTIFQSGVRSGVPNLNVTFDLDESQEKKATDEEAKLGKLQVDRARNVHGKKKSVNRKTYVVADMEKALLKPAVSELRDEVQKKVHGDDREEQLMAADVANTGTEMMPITEAQQENATIEDAIVGLAGSRTEPKDDDKKVRRSNKRSVDDRITPGQQENEVMQDIVRLEESGAEKSAEVTKKRRSSKRPADAKKSVGEAGGKPSKRARSEVLEGPEGDPQEGPAASDSSEQQRRPRRGKVVSYKEPSLNKKMRRGDPISTTVYSGLAGKTSEKAEKATQQLATE